MALIQQWAHVSPSLPFVACVLTEVVFDIPHQIQSQLGFGFPDFISACLDSVSICFLVYLSLLLPFVCFLSVFEFGQELLAHPHSSPSICA